MRQSLKTIVLGIIIGPILKRLGYRAVVKSEHALPSSHYYVERSPASDLISLHQNYLNSSGWLESRNNNRSYFDNQYQPWLTFPAIHFLSGLDLSKMIIVEFGGGASTFFFSRRASKVFTYEFDISYATHLKLSFSETPNVEIIEPDVSCGLLNHWSQSSDLNPKFDSITDQILQSDLFVKSISDVLSKADLIMIDGGPRNLSMLLAARYSNRDALIIVDNSESSDLSQGISELKNAGFKEIPFKGLGPLNPYEWVTSLFLRHVGSI